MKNPIILLIVMAFSFTIQAQNFDGKAGKIWYADDILYINMVEKGVLVIDNKNPQKPKKLGFIEIPGNIDIAIKDKVLYANNNDDLVALDISKLKKVSNKKVLTRFKGIFSQLSKGSDKIQWHEPTKKRWVSSSVSVVSSNSQGGSMASFTLEGDYLYTINGKEIHTFNVAKAKKPECNNRPVPIKGDNIETIFSADGRLFIGAQKGLYIYGLENPTTPNHLGTYKHMQSCDPVVVQGNLAYITLRDGTECNHAVNMVEVVDISNPSRPKKIGGARATHPHGLAVEGNTMYLCDGRAGFKVVDTSNPRRLRTIKKFEEVQNTYDVIALSSKKILLMVGETELIQYDYSDKYDLKKLSKVAVTNEF